MTQAIDTATEPDLRRRLAQQPCPRCKGLKLTEQPCDCSGVEEVHLKACPDCQDTDGNSTGLALLWASQECPSCGGKQRILKHILVLDDGTGQPYVSTDDDYDPCTHCVSGRVPKADLGLEVIMETIPDSDWHFVSDRDGGGIWCYVDYGPRDWREQAKAFGDSHTLAALRAVAKAGMR